MAKIMMTKEEFEKRQAELYPEMGKKGISLFGLIAIIMIASSAISWIGFISIKNNGGKLPWEK